MNALTDVKYALRQARLARDKCFTSPLSAADCIQRCIDALERAESELTPKPAPVDPLIAELRRAQDATRMAGCTSGTVAGVDDDDAGFETTRILEDLQKETK